MRSVTCTAARRFLHLAMLVCAALVGASSSSSANARELLVVGRDAELVREVCEVLAARGAQPASKRYESRWTKLNEEYLSALTGIIEAQRAYRAGDLDAAWQKITEVITSMERCYSVIPDFEVLARAYLFRADLANARGDTATAEDSYLVAARLGGELKLDPASTSPLIIEGYETAKELLASSPTGSLTVITKPAAALVSIDGQRRGAAPLTLALPAGPHLVKAELPGHDDWSAQVPVMADDIKPIEIFLQQTSPVDLAAADASPQRVRALQTVDGERDWLVVNRVGAGLTFSYLEVGGDIVDGGPVHLEELTAALEQGEEPQPEEPEEPSWPWILAGVGAGVGALSAIGALTIEGALFFTDVGDGQQRLDLQLGERLLLGLAGIGLIAGGVGAAVALTAPVDVPASGARGSGE